MQLLWQEFWRPLDDVAHPLEADVDLPAAAADLGRPESSRLLDRQLACGVLGREQLVLDRWRLRRKVERRRRRRGGVEGERAAREQVEGLLG